MISGMKFKFVRKCTKTYENILPLATGLSKIEDTSMFTPFWVTSGTL